MRFTTRLLALTLPLMLLAAPAVSGTQPGEENVVYDPAAYQALKYRMIGPHKGSRVTAVTGIAEQPWTYFMGTNGGGLWKTTDAGESWVNASDGYYASSSIGAIDVADSDASIVYVGTGSACIRGNVSPGDGIYKSTDGGESWTHLGLHDAGQIGRLVIHPENPDVAYAAVLGHAFGPNEMRGVFRTTDGGASWEKALYVSERTGANDIAMDPSDPNVLYATMWTGERKPWTMISGSEEGGIYKTTDGGDTWAQLENGLPTGMIGRTGISVSAANPNRVWALVEARDGGVYRSDDAGASFTLVNDDRELQNRPWYYMHIVADPVDVDRVYVVSRFFHRSDDAGETFDLIATPHGDNHDLWINPENNAVLIEGNDGGANISWNAGNTWSSQLNQPTSEMYRVSVDNQFPYRVYGSAQDTWEVLSVPSRSGHYGMRLQLQHWDGVGGMEGGVAVIRPDNPDIVYAGSTSGAITRYDRSTGQIRPIKAYPEVGGLPAKHLRYRFQRTAPIVLSPHDPNILYHASHVVHRSTNEGQSWEVISPDLTTGDPERINTWGGPITREVSSEEVYCTIFALAESKHLPGVLWAGTDDGLVHLSRDGGENWKNITPADMPDSGTVNILEVSPHAAGRAFISVLRFRLDDFRPYVFRTDDFGESWELLTDGTNGIPADQFVRVVREDPDRKGLLYAGTEYGVFVSFDDGGHWQSLQLNFPVAPVTDLVVHEKDLVLSTKGRSFWILDDLSPLHQLTDDVASAAAHLFAPRDIHRVRTAEEEAVDEYVGGWRSVANPRDLYGGARITRDRQGTDSPNGATIYPWFAEAPEGEVTLEILDSAGEVVRRFSNQDDPPDPSVIARPEAPFFKEESTFSRAGLNRFVWDVRHASAYGGSPLGPLVVPGAYQVRVSTDGWSGTQPIEVLPDPRVTTTSEEFQSQFDLLLKLRDRISDLHRAVAEIRELREGASESVADRLSAIERELVPLPEDYDRDDQDYAPKLIQQLDLLYGYVEGADSQPTDAAFERFDDLDPVLSGLLEELRRVVESGDLGQGF